MKKTATISAILAVVGFMAVYVALCYLVPGWRLKLHATAWVYFAASLRHMALLKGVFAMAAGLVPMLPLSKKKSGTPMSAPLPKQMSCRFVRLNNTLVLTLVKSFGTLT